MDEYAKLNLSADETIRSRKKTDAPEDIQKGKLLYFRQENNNLTGLLMQKLSTALISKLGRRNTISDHSDSISRLSYLSLAQVSLCQ